MIKTPEEFREAIFQVGVKQIALAEQITALRKLYEEIIFYVQKNASLGGMIEAAAQRAEKKFMAEVTGVRNVVPDRTIPCAQCGKTLNTAVDGVFLVAGRTICHQCAMVEPNTGYLVPGQAIQEPPPNL